MRESRREEASEDGEEPEDAHGANANTPRRGVSYPATVRSLGVSLALALALVLLPGCGGHDGRLIVVVDSDIATLTDVAVRTTRLAGGGVDTRDIHLDATTHVPFSFAIEPNGHPQDGVDIVIEGYDCAPPCTAIVTRRVQTGFVANSTRVVRMFLASSCAGSSAPTCGTTQSCDRGSCVELYVPPDTLGTLLHPGDELDGGRDGAVDEDTGAIDGGTLDAGTDAATMDGGTLDDAAMDDAWTAPVDAWAPTPDSGASEPMLIATLTQPDHFGSAINPTYYGSAMALDTPGTTLVVGAPGANHVDLWQDVGGWSRTHDQLGSGALGGAVAIAQPSSVPSTPCLVVLGDHQASSYVGATVVTDCSLGGAEIVPNGFRINEMYGASVALSRDGLQLAVGAPGVPLTAAGGRVWFPSSGNQVPSATSNGTGSAVTIARDGSGVFSSPQAVSALTDLRGVLYAFSAAHEVTEIAVTNTSYRSLGARLAESDDGSWLAASSQRAAGNDVVVLFSNVTGTWEASVVLPTQTRTTTARLLLLPDSVPIAMDAAGRHLVVGDPGANAATVYVRSGMLWTPHALPSQGPNFGSGVAISGDGTRVAVAAPTPDETPAHVYVFAVP